jgi:hypothetical protein
MAEDEKYIILNELIQKDFQMDEEESLISGDEALDLDTLHKRLSILVAYLLENDMHRLLNGMYRLDVSEAKFHDAMYSDSKQEAAIHIADLIIEREMQKVKTRLHYKKHRKF